MLFCSLTFLYYFLPCMLAVYFTVPGRFQNAALLLGSLFFYAWGEPKYVFLMAGIIGLTYLFGLLIEAYRNTAAGRIFCILSVCICLWFLLYYKYAGFLLANINALTGLSFHAANVVLPVGISFYTFQAVSYLIDVHKGAAAQRRIVCLALYIAMFPQLIAGPIVRYSDIAEQLRDREHSWDLAAAGIRRFLYGMAKKILLANQLGELCRMFLETQERSVLYCWLYAVAFMLHIYFDFSGYSDMAIGLGRIFGFRFLENFHDPYSAKSITAFWRRWHISLGMWFRDYVYIPMGGNRTGRGRQVFHIFIVWMLTGLWHGAAWNFVAWGLFFAVLLMIEKLWLLPILQTHPVFAAFYTLFFVMISFVIFDAPDLSRAAVVIGGLFAAGGIPLASAEAWYCLKSFGVVLVLAVLCAAPSARMVIKRLLNRGFGRAAGCQTARVAGFAVLLLVMTAYLVDGSFEPFLYFRF
ncbi:MAG: MBOAT family protein [Eubacterium sp.]|nr:MBOAT family protein [Eubacterium sp.]